MQPYKLRPHHGLCSSFFCGHGYSADFTEHMTKTLLHFQQHNPQILLTVGADCICAACPHCCHDCCSSAEQVERYDRAVSEQLRTSRRRCACLERLSPTGTRTDSAYRNLSAYLRNVFLVFHLQPERCCCYQSGIFTKTDSSLNLQSDQRKNGKQVSFCFPFFFICATCLHCCHSCGSQESDILDWNAFRRQVQEQILHTEIFPHICGTCSWYSICSRKEATAISQAFLQKQILP